MLALRCCCLAQLSLLLPCRRHFRLPPLTVSTTCPTRPTTHPPLDLARRPRVTSSTRPPRARMRKNGPARACHPRL
ncbi:hypothetical protein DFH11DRAFT_1640723 [Phellopilus nigrolimitatus]|nr:hypothetical protein DFH11DRAFT_1640723 [Phellopilus nigrolimitatus]